MHMVDDVRKSLYSATIRQCFKKAWFPSQEDSDKDNGGWGGRLQEVNFKPSFDILCTVHVDSM
jgi:hypothetical protein